MIDTVLRCPVLNGSRLLPLLNSWAALALAVAVLLVFVPSGQAQERAYSLPYVGCHQPINHGEP